MNLLKRLAQRFFYGKPQPRWLPCRAYAFTDDGFTGPESPLPNLLTPCLRPAGDPRKMRHYYGRGETRTAACIRCGSPAPPRPGG